MRHKKRKVYYSSKARANLFNSLTEAERWFLYSNVEYTKAEELAELTGFDIEKIYAYQRFTSHFYWKRELGVPIRTKMTYDSKFMACVMDFEMTIPKGIAYCLNLVPELVEDYLEEAKATGEYDRMLEKYKIHNEMRFEKIEKLRNELQEILHV